VKHVHPAGAALAPIELPPRCQAFQITFQFSIAMPDKQAERIGSPLRAVASNLRHRAEYFNPSGSAF
jgi:hypothetical protein